MELHRLDGFDSTGIDHMDIQDSSEYINGMSDPPEIAYEILDDQGNVVMYADIDENIYVIDGLGGFFKKIGRGLKRFARKVVKPVVKTFNRFLNPATILLRNGFLLAMKINMFKVASKLRFGYLSEAAARKRGGDMRKFAKMRKAIRKAEKIYETAGGKKRNLKRAILKGKGNKDRAVPLSGVALGNPFDDDGPTIYNDPFEKFVVESDPDMVEAFVNNEIQVEGLGAIATSASIAAATGAVAGIATLVGKIGNIFGKAKQIKQQAKKLFQKPKPSTPRLPPPREIRRPAVRPSPITRRAVRPSRAVVSRNTPLPASKSAVSEKKKSFFEKNKTLVIIGGLAIVGTGIAIAIQSNKKKTAKAVSGIPKKTTGSNKRKSLQRDELGRFTSRSSKQRRKRKTPKKLIPKALL
ncbi:hypothetical protein [Aquimarina aquimarini]|uniref:hypothetical protein n=1 Tax=Aquimarina aquimarini TaxID=1191734 RepID=UPI000D55E9A0|nr:hypothetical protein [Aquimarina aquimarini]